MVFEIRDRQLSLYDLPQGQVRKDFRRPRFSFFRFNCQTAASRWKSEDFRKTEARPHNLSGAEPVSLRSRLIRVGTPEKSREGPNRVGRVSSVAVDGRCIAPGSFRCQRRIQKKFEKVCFPRKSGGLRGGRRDAKPPSGFGAHEFGCGQNWATFDRLLFRTSFRPANAWFGGRPRFAAAGFLPGLRRATRLTP